MSIPYKTHNGISQESSIQITGGQPGCMGVAATPEYKEGAYWTHTARKEFEGSDQKCFDHHTLYVGYNPTNVFYSAMKAAKGVGGLAPRKN